MKTPNDPTPSLYDLMVEAFRKIEQSKRPVTIGDILIGTEKIKEFIRKDLELKP